MKMNSLQGIGILNIDMNTNHYLKNVGYWRKAKAIHNWFVENVQDGKDDCSYYEVSKSKLIELRNLCQLVLDTAITKK